jgi:hypothetical protein
MFLISYHVVRKLVTQLFNVWVRMVVDIEDDNVRKRELLQLGMSNESEDFYVSSTV